MQPEGAVTEAEWNTSQDPQAMLTHAGAMRKYRKLRLFSVACCRRIWRFLSPIPSQTSVETVERFLDGQASVEEMRRVGNIPYGCGDDPLADLADGAAGYCCATDACNIDEYDLRYARIVAAEACHVVTTAASRRNEVNASEETVQAHLLRDIFGPLPFRPINIDPSLLTAAVVTLAQSAYEERKLPEGTLDLSRLAKVADAIEEAGVSHSELLAHLRSEGPHYRGCWGLDCVLGRS
jgi:hypothetical protein